MFTSLLSPDEKEYIIILYNQGLNCHQISREVNRSTDCVWGFLKRSGYDTAKSVYQRLSDSDVFDICSMYNSGCTAKQILPNYPSLKSENSIIKIVRDNGGIVRRGGYQNIIEQEDFFENIDTEEKGYILGILITEGYIIYPNRDSYRNPLWGITLKIDDEYLLNRIKKIIGVQRKICRRKKNSNEYTESILSATSIKMVSDLSAYGVVPRKSKTIGFPVQISNEIRPHVIRGIFDGDGCISKQNCSLGVSRILCKLKIGAKEGKIYYGAGCRNLAFHLSRIIAGNGRCVKGGCSQPCIYP